MPNVMAALPNIGGALCSTPLPVLTVSINGGTAGYLTLQNTVVVKKAVECKILGL